MSVGPPTLLSYELELEVDKAVVVVAQLAPAASSAAKTELD